MQEKTDNITKVTMRGEHDMYEPQPHTAGYAKRDHDLMTPGQLTTTIQKTRQALYSEHTDHATPDEATNHPNRPLWQFWGVGNNPNSEAHARPRAQSCVQSLY